MISRAGPAGPASLARANDERYESLARANDERYEAVDNIILDDGTPIMPREADEEKQTTHRPRDHQVPLVRALIHKLLTPADVRGNKPAEAAITKEKDKLVDRGTWSEDPKDVREWSSVAHEARLKGKVAHTAIVFPIYSIKNSELPVSDSRRIHKGRIVLGGNNIRDQGGQWAIFHEIASTPATLEAIKVVDVMALQPDWEVEDADAESAFNQ
jgi:hypothetical protein